MLITLPNFLSFLRFPLAFLFLIDHPFYRVTAIILAMATDGIDGYIARKYQQSSRLGTVLDPISDKFFVLFALVVLLEEARVAPWQVVTMLCRDVSVFLFGIYLTIKQQLFRYQFKAIYCGKVTTLMQFAVLLSLSCNIVLPSYLFAVFILLGMFALVELYITSHAQVVEE